MSKSSQKVPQTGRRVSPRRWLGLPTWAQPGVVKVRAQDRQPFEKSFNLAAAARYDDTELCVSWRQEIDRHLKVSDHSHDDGKKGSVGWIAPPGWLVIDCDNKEAVRWMKSIAPKSTPYQQRTESSAHFYFRYDPDTIFVYSRNGIRYDTKSEHAIEKASFDIRCCTNKTGARGGTCVVIPPSKREDGNHYKWKVRLPDDPSKAPFIPDELLKALRTVLAGKKTKKRQDSRHVRSLRFQRRLIIEAEVDTPEARDEIRKAAVEFAEEIYQGDDDRLAMELDDIDRQLEGAYQMEGAFQGFQRDGTAESIAVEVTQLGEGGIAYVVEEKSWRMFDGTCWINTSDQAVMKMIGDHYREYLADAAIEDDDDQVKKLTDIAIKLKGAPFVKQVCERMKNNLYCSLADFDTQVELITFPGDEEKGIAPMTMDVMTGETWEPCMEDMITKTMGVPYVPSAKHPTVDEYWRTSFPNKETRECVQTHLGMSMCGWIPEERIYFMHGRGASGKGTLANATMLCLGEYGDESDPSTWSGNGAIDGSRNAPDLARLRGKRFVFIDEIASTKRLGSKAKQLSQDGFVTAADKYMKQTRFPITWTPWIAGNARPKIDSTDPGLMRRIIEIPMNAGSDTPTSPDWHVKDTLKRDPDAQLAWMRVLVDGLSRAREHEFRPPMSKEMQTATKEWAETADPIGDWWAARIERTDSPSDEVQAGTLLADYNDWMYEHMPREERANKNQFGPLLMTRGLEKEKRGGVVRYRGIRIKSVEEGVLGADVMPKLPN